MKNDFRSRILLPILIPVLIVVVMAAFIGMVAALFLYNTKTGALALAAVAAGGILFAVALATSRDRLDARGRVVLGMAAALAGGQRTGDQRARDVQRALHLVDREHPARPALERPCFEGERTQHVDDDDAALGPCAVEVDSPPVEGQGFSPERNAARRTRASTIASIATHSPRWCA